MRLRTPTQRGALLVGEAGKRGTDRRAKPVRGEEGVGQRTERGRGSRRVVERRLEDRLTAGFARQDVNRLTEAIESERVEPDREKAVQMELEAGRKRDRMREA